MHAIASLLPVPTCTCGLTFSTADLLQAHITASLGSGSSSGSDPTPAAPAATPFVDPRPLAAICATTRCGHPRIAHGDRGACRILLAVASGGVLCPCRGFS